MDDTRSSLKRQLADVEENKRIIKSRISELVDPTTRPSQWDKHLLQYEKEISNLKTQLAELDEQERTASELSLQKAADELQQAESLCLENLKTQILKMYVGRQVIELEGEIGLPEADQIDTEFILRANRHQISLLMHQSGKPMGEPEKMSLSEAAQRHDLLMILGPPGSGKSWTLGDIALQHIRQYETGESRTLPLLAYASEWQPQQSPIDFLRAELRDILAEDDSFNENNPLLQRFEADLTAGRYLVLIDALNEMPHRRISPFGFQQAQQKRVPYSSEQSEALRIGFRRSVGDKREWDLNELVDATPETRYIATCRTLDYEPRTLPWTQAQIQSLDEEQIANFVESRLIDFGDAADRMLEELKSNPVAKSLAENPFHLEVMIAVFKKRGLSDLPRRRAKLLEELVTQRLLDISKLKLLEGPEVSLDQCHTTLSHLALRMLDAGYAGAQAPESIIRPHEWDAINLAKNAGLLSFYSQKDSGQTIAFYHELIQEYYAASGLANGLQRVSINKLLRDQRWAEVIALWYELEENEKKQRRLFKRIVTGLNQRTGLHNTPSMPCSIALIHMLLAPLLPCLLGAILVEWMTQPGILSNALFTYPVIVISLVILIPVITWRLWRAWSIDFTVKRNAAHIVALLPHNETAPVAVDRMTRLLNHCDFIRNKPLVDALVKLGDFSRVRLKEILYSGNSRARFAASVALAQIGDTSEIEVMSRVFVGNYPPLEFDKGANWWRQIKQGWQALKQLWKFFSNLLRFSVVIPSAQKIGDTLIMHLAQMWKSSSNELEQGAISALLAGIPGSLPSGIALELVDDTADQKAFGIAIIMLSKTGDTKSIERIFALLAENKIPDQNKQQVLFNLQNVNPGDKPILIKNLDNPNPDARRVSAMLLGKVGGQEGISGLIELLEDEHLGVQLAAINALGQLSAIQAKEPLRELVLNTEPTDADTLKRLCSAIYALASLGEPDVVSDITAVLSRLPDSGLDQRVSRIITITVLESLEKLASPDALPTIGDILIKPNQDKGIFRAALQVIKATKDPGAIDIIEKVPYNEDPNIRVTIIETLKELGPFSQRNVTRLLQSYFSDTDSEVRQAAQRTLTQLSPVLQPQAVIDLKLGDDTLGTRMQKSFLYFTGLELVDAIGRMYWRIMKQIMVQGEETTLMRGSVQLIAPNPLANQIFAQHMQEAAQMGADLSTTRTGLQKWGCSFLLIWLPIFLVSAGIFYILRIPGITLEWVSQYPLISLWGFLSVLVAAVALPGSRKAAREWFLPTIIGLAFGIPIYALIFQLFNFREYWWVWILFGVLYITIIGIGVRFRLDKHVPEIITISFVSLPVLPIAFPGIVFFVILNESIEEFHERWWIPVIAGIATGWTGWLLMELLAFYGVLPYWWSSVVWGVMGLALGLAFLSDWKPIKRWKKWLEGLGFILPSVVTLPGLPAGLWFSEEINRFGTRKIKGNIQQQDAGPQTLAFWLAIIPSGLVYLKVISWLFDFVPPTILIAVLGVSVISYILGVILRRLGKELGSFIISLPATLFLLPLRIITLTILVIFNVLPPIIVMLLVILLKLVPWKPSKMLAGLIEESMKGGVIPTIIGLISMVFGAIFAVDMGRRLLLVVPPDWLPFILPFALLWLAVLILGIHAYRQNNFVTLTVLSLPIILPLLPFLVVFVSVTIIVALIGFMLQSRETSEVQPKTVSEEPNVQPA